MVDFHYAPFGEYYRDRHRLQWTRLYVTGYRLKPNQFLVSDRNCLFIVCFGVSSSSAGITLITCTVPSVLEWVLPKLFTGSTLFFWVWVSCVWVSAKWSGIFIVFGARWFWFLTLPAVSLCLFTEILLPFFQQYFSLTAWAIFFLHQIFLLLLLKRLRCPIVSHWLAGDFSKISGDISCFICSFIWTSSLFKTGSQNSTKKVIRKIRIQFFCTRRLFFLCLSLLRIHFPETGGVCG